MNLKKSISVLLILVMCLSLFAGIGAVASADSAMIEGTLEIGDAMPDFSVTLPDGSVFTLSEVLAEKDAVLINIWGTWCHNCVDEMPAMQEAYEQYADRVGLIGLSNTDDDDAIIAFQQAKNLNLPLAYDTIGLSDALAYEGFPTTIMVDRFGNYAFYHCGALTEVGEFTRMFDYFLSEDYTESEIVEDIPGPAYTGEYPTDDELTAALCADGSFSFSCESTDGSIWPFVVTENGVVNSNALQQKTTAVLCAKGNVKAGDILAFDYVSDIEDIFQSVTIELNGEFLKTIDYSRESTFTYEFPEDGEVSICFTYEENKSAKTSEYAGTIEISNFRIASEEDVAAILASKPATLHALEGDDFQLEILNEGVKKIVLTYPEGAEDLKKGIEASIGAFDLLIVPDDVASFRILLGENYDVENIFGYAVKNSYEFFFGPRLETDEEGYLLDLALCSMQAGEECYVMLELVPDTSVSDDQVAALLIFRDEANANTFINEYLGGSTNGLSWMYEDGTLPTVTDVIVGTDRYTITVVDENGDPVYGCMVNICDESNCCPQFLMDTNTYSFNGINDVAYPYAIHIVIYPQGYTFDTTQEFILNENGDNLTIVVPHA